MNEAQVMAAVDSLNEQLLTLPNTVYCQIEDIYPEFDCPGQSPDVYLALVEDEARQVKAQIDQAEESQKEPLQQLLAMLVECALSLRLLGVTLPGDDLEASDDALLAGGAETGNEPPGPSALHT